MKRGVAKGFLKTFFVFLLPLFATNPVFAAPYDIVDLGLGTFSQVNENGISVGTFTDNSGLFRGVVWSDGVRNELETLGGGATATSINNFGQIAGTSRFQPGPGAQHAVIWTNGVISELTSVAPAAYMGVAGINSRGQVVGYQMDSLGEVSHVFLWDNGKSTNLLSEYAKGFPDGINNKGQVIGRLRLENGTYEAFLWQNGTFTPLTINDSTRVRASGINDAGQIVGSGPNGAFLWQNGNSTTIGNFGPASINDFSQVVGVGTAGNPVICQNGSLYDLSDLTPLLPGWILTSAVDINDRGQILINGTVNGENHGFLLTPEENSQFNPVPEPSTMLLLGSGLVGLWGFRKRLRKN